MTKAQQVEFLRQLGHEKETGMLERGEIPDPRRRTRQLGSRRMTSPDRKEPADVIGDDGRVRVLSQRCSTCLFRKDQPFGKDLPAQVIRANVEAGALLTCHKTLPDGEHPGFGPAVCAAFWALHALETAAGQMAQFLIGITRITPPA
jgi:hypothetical protein